MALLTPAFWEGCKCVRDGAGGAALSHVGCVALPLAAGALGASLSGQFLMAAMFVTSPLIAAGATYLMDRWRGQAASVPKLIGSAAVALVVAFGIHTMPGHDHGHGGHHDHQHDHDHHHMAPFMTEADICRTDPDPDTVWRAVTEDLKL